MEHFWKKTKSQVMGEVLRKGLSLGGAMNIDNLPVANEKRGERRGKDVPTTDDEVRETLRRLGEPITYFGEDKSDRRERLIELLNNRGDGDINMEEGDEEEEEETEEEDDDNEEFYTPGGEELIAVRKEILAYSMPKAETRTLSERERSKGQNFVKILKHRRNINSRLQEMELYGSQSLATRALSKIRYSNFTEGEKQRLLVGSWDGSLHVLDSEDLLIISQLNSAHSEKVSAVDWGVDNTNVLSGGGEGDINIWRVSDPTQNAKIDSSRAHAGFRITETLYHPSGRYFASASFDQTWKLWDSQTLAEIYQQEGHSKEVYCASFHPDGGLLATAGLDAIARVWDLRSGRSIATLEGHIKGIYSTDWSPNGHQLATASGDCSVKIWDLRNPKLELFSIPAHNKLISDVRFYGGNSGKVGGFKEVTDENGKNPSSLTTQGTFLVSSSYDGEVCVWSADNWIKVKTLKGHSDKVMSCDISETGVISSCGWDRTVKIWNN